MWKDGILFFSFILTKYSRKMKLLFENYFSHISLASKNVNKITPFVLKTKYAMWNIQLKLFSTKIEEKCLQ